MAQPATIVKQRVKPWNAQLVARQSGCIGTASRLSLSFELFRRADK